MAKASKRETLPRPAPHQHARPTAAATATFPVPRTSAAPEEPGRWQRVYAVVARIPAGRVATYGQIAELAGLGRGARQVGYALHALPHSTRVPWQRVINSRGEISLRRAGGHDLTQRMLLEREGVQFDPHGRVNLAEFRWNGRPKRGR